MRVLARALVLWLTERSLVRRIVQRSRPGRVFAGRFVAGDGLQDGLHAAEDLAGRGISTMLDHLGENVDTADQAAAAADAYILALKQSRERPDLDCNISVKLTQLGLDAGVDVCRENVERVLQVAAETSPPTLVMIDMEAHEYVDRTLDLYLSLRDRYPALGVCLQACLRRTVADAERIGGPAAIVRMTKGAYLEPPDIAHQRRSQVDHSYVEVASRLFESGATIHLATHDERLVRGAIDYLDRTEVPKERYEFQMLFGIRRDLQSQLVGSGQPVRVYVPYGTQWYPYLTRRMAERPANVWFFLSNAVRWRG
jgi:proline dehydrogenase